MIFPNFIANQKKWVFAIQILLRGKIFGFAQVKFFYFFFEKKVMVHFFFVRYKLVILGVLGRF